MSDEARNRSFTKEESMSRLTNAELHDAVFGAGPMSSPWWLEYENPFLAMATEDIPADWKVTGKVATPEYVDGYEEEMWENAKSFEITAKDLREAIEKIVEQDDLRDDIVEACRSVLRGDDDIDSEVADCIVQMAALGECPYS